MLDAMSLSRAHLESGYFQKLAAERAQDGRPPPLSAEQLELSLGRALACAPARDHVWVFGYGSLVWNPLFDFDRHEPVKLFGSEAMNELKYWNAFCTRGSRLPATLRRVCVKDREPVAWTTVRP